MHNETVTKNILLFNDDNQKLRTKVKPDNFLCSRPKKRQNKKIKNDEKVEKGELDVLFEKMKNKNEVKKIKENKIKEVKEIKENNKSQVIKKIEIDEQTPKSKYKSIMLKFKKHEENVDEESKVEENIRISFKNIGSLGESEQKESSRTLMPSSVKNVNNSAAARAIRGQF